MEHKPWVPADLLQLSAGYWSVCALHAGVKLDVFTPLAESSMTIEELAGRLKCDRRGLTMLLNSLAALDLVLKQGESYAATSFSAEFLSHASPNYLGYIIQHHHGLMQLWVHLDQAVISGGPVKGSPSRGDDETMRENFEMGMFNLAMQIAPSIIPHIDLSGRKRLLDLGGGPGTYAIHFCRHYADLSAVVYDLPSTQPFADKIITKFGMNDRIRFEAGDFDLDDIQGSFDVVWLSHVLHAKGPEECAVIIKKAVAALEPGGMFLVQEFILNDSMDTPLFPALFSMNMLLGTQNGRSYSQRQLFDMLSAAGVAELRRIPLDLPNGAGVVAGIVPG